jgi:hypothetical protein
MSAPLFAYFEIDAKFKGSNNVTMAVLPARSIYGSASNLAAALALIKSNFYLDDIIAFKARYAGVEYHGFWGTCIVGSANYYMHKISRRLDIGGPTFGSDKRTFNDAGLNTLGISEVPVCTNKQSGANVFQAFFKSAYYVPTSSHYVRANRIVGGVSNFNQIVQLGAMAANTSAVKVATSEAVTFDFTAGDYIEIESTVVNEEGTYTSARSSFIVEPRQYSAKFNATWASWACNNTNGTTTVTVYATNWKLGNGVVLYADLGMADNVPPGYYSINGRWYKVEADFMIGAYITDQDACGTWRQGDPAWIPPYETRNWIHYVTILSGSDAGCFIIGTSGTLTPRTTYRNLNNNKFYATSAGAIAAGASNYTPDGYYFETSGGITTWIEIQSGVLTNSGSC